MWSFISGTIWQLGTFRCEPWWNLGEPGARFPAHWSPKLCWQDSKLFLRHRGTIHSLRGSLSPYIFSFPSQQTFRICPSSWTPFRGCKMTGKVLRVETMPGTAACFAGMGGEYPRHRCFCRLWGWAAFGCLLQSLGLTHLQICWKKGRYFKTTTLGDPTKWQKPIQCYHRMVVSEVCPVLLDAFVASWWVNRFFRIPSLHHLSTSSSTFSTCLFTEGTNPTKLYI